MLNINKVNKWNEQIKKLKLKLQSEKIYNNKMKLQMRIQILELKVKEKNQQLSNPLTSLSNFRNVVLLGY